MSWNIVKNVGKFINLTNQADDRTPNAGLYRTEKFGKKCSGYLLAGTAISIFVPLISKGLVELFTTPPQHVNNKSVEPYRRHVPKR